jgi:ribosomal protein L12E/L44/L45/RPP1/RPP2
MIGKLASSTTATIAISLVVLLVHSVSGHETQVSIEKLQTRSACAKVLATPPVSVIEEDDDEEEEEEEEASEEEEDDDEEEVITIQEVVVC